MSARPRISVIVPCYNAERYIAATLDSVLSQQWPELEVIVVDDGSSDGSAALLRQRYPQVRLLSQANQGVAAARNKGLAEANAEWIAFVDADDIWLPGKLEEQWRALCANPGARMCYAPWAVWQSEQTVPDPALIALVAAQADDSPWRSASGWIYPQLLLDCVVWTSTVLAHRSVFDEVGNFDSGLRIGEDYDLWLRASRVTPILRTPRPLALYRAHPASITRSAPSANYQGLVLQRALDRWGLNSPDGQVADAAGVRRSLAQSWVHFAAAQLAADRPAQALDAARNALRADAGMSAAWKILIKSCLRLARASLLPQARKTP